MNWKLIFEKGMFWILILTSFIGGFIRANGTRGINKTVGWTFDQSNQWYLNGIVIFGSLLIFLFGYGITALMNKKTNLSLSIMHFGLFVLTMIMAKLGDLFSSLIFIICVISVLIFGINMYLTLRNKMVNHNEKKPTHNNGYNK